MMRWIPIFLVSNLPICVSVIYKWRNPKDILLYDDDGSWQELENRIEMIKQLKLIKIINNERLDNTLHNIEAVVNSMKIKTIVCRNEVNFRVVD